MRSGLRLSAPCRSKDGEEISGLLLPRRGSACSPMAVESVLVLTSSRCWGINTNYQTLRYFTTVNEPPTVVFTITDAHELHVIRNPWFFEICLLPRAIHENSPVEISMKFTSEAAEQHQGHRGTLGQIAGRRGHLRFQLEGFLLANDWRSDQPESRKLHARHR